MTAAALRSHVEEYIAGRAGPGRFGLEPARLSWREKPAREVIPTGIPGIAIPRGTLSEIHGPASSGRTAILHAALARATRNPECCALIDTSDCFDPQSAEAAGVQLPWLLWVRCGGSAEKALKSADLVVQAGGFGIVAFDLAGVPIREARRISLASWFRLRNAVEKTSTALVVVGEELNAHSCSTLQVNAGHAGYWLRGNLLEGLDVEAALGPRVRSRTRFRLRQFYRN